jgi:hypothetical protein
LRRGYAHEVVFDWAATFIGEFWGLWPLKLTNERDAFTNGPPAAAVMRAKRFSPRIRTPASVRWRSDDPAR